MQQKVKLDGSCQEAGGAARPVHLPLGQEWVAMLPARHPLVWVAAQATPLGLRLRRLAWAAAPRVLLPRPQAVVAALLALPAVLALEQRLAQRYWTRTDWC